MPHLSELQQQYAEKGVTIVSVSSEPLETVNAFLKQEARNQTAEDGEPKTYDDVTKHYCLTTDPDGSTSTDYMKAAKQNGIPCAFLVGKDGHVEWIGHPMRMDEPLQKVVTDEWDREAFAVSYKQEQEFEATMEEIMRLAMAADGDAVRERLSELTENPPSPELGDRAARARPQVEFYLFNGRLRHDQAAAAAQLPELVETLGDSDRTLRMITTTVLRGAKRNEPSPELLQAVVDMITPSHQNGEASDRLVGMLARVVHLQGDAEMAAELAEGVLENAEGSLKKSMEKLLEELSADAQAEADTATPAGSGEA